MVQGDAVTKELVEQTGLKERLTNDVQPKGDGEVVVAHREVAPGAYVLATDYVSQAGRDGSHKARTYVAGRHPRPVATMPPSQNEAAICPTKTARCAAARRTFSSATGRSSSGRLRAGSGARSAKTTRQRARLPT